MEEDDKGIKRITDEGNNDKRVRCGGYFIYEY